MASDESTTTDSPETSIRGMKERDYYLPNYIVSRIMRKAIPANGKVTQEAKDCVQECASEFVAFITSEANERCARERRKSITGDDVIWAMQSLGLDNYVEPLRLYLQRYRESEARQAGSQPAGQVEWNASGSVAIHGGSEIQAIQAGVQPAGQVEWNAGGSVAIHGGSEIQGGQQGSSHPRDDMDLS